MNTQSPVQSNDDSIKNKLLSPIGIVLMACYLVVIIAFWAYLGKTPVYTASIKLVLPGTGSSTRINLDNIGQVTSQTIAPFNSKEFSPKVNYKQILSSPSLIKKSADEMRMSNHQFGTPNIKLIPQTSILEVTLSSHSRQQAFNKLTTLYQQFQNELETLRQDEIQRRDDSVNVVLSKYKQTMNDKLVALQAFKSDSLLVSNQQIDRLINLQATIAEKIYLTQSEVGKTRAYTQRLSKDLGVSSQTASFAFALQSDIQFKSLTEELAASRAELADFNGKYGTKHPKVINASERYEHTYQALIKRSNELIGKRLDASFYSLDLTNNQHRSALFAELISSSAMAQGREQEISTLIHSEALVKEKLLVYTLQSASLDRLQKEFDLAEAVYTSAAARLEASKADVFASYPIVQLLSQPLVPDQPSSPNKPLGLLLTVLANLFITSSLVVLCKRKTIVNALLKKH